MQHVQGIGGVFLYAADAAALAAWYQRHLGLELQRWGESYGVELPSADRQPSDRVTTTTFSIFSAEGAAGPLKSARINYRVRDLDALLATLEREGVPCEGRQEDYGRFAWVRDPEGNRIELWEPPVAGPKE